MPLLYPDQRTEGWLAARKGKITASIAAACLGMSPHTSRQNALRVILGTEPESVNDYMRWGVEHEADARDAYEVETGRLVTPTGFWVHPTLPWLGASPDGLVDDDGLVEIKCPSEQVEQVGLPHRVQMLVTMAVTQRVWCDYFSWTPTSIFLRTVEPVPYLDVLLVRLKDFYEQHVLTGIEPPRKAPGPDMCPTCGLPMLNLSLDSRAVFWCPSCGTVQDNGFPPAVPSLAGLCLELGIKLTGKKT